jgi:PAS domain S-box-containing protein
VAQERVRQIREEGREVTPAERRIRTGSGQEKEIEIMATPFVNDEGARITLAIFRDITARKTMERAVRESEGRFRAISEAIPLPVLISDAATMRLLYVNPEARTQLAVDDAFIERASLFDLAADRGFRAGLTDVLHGLRGGDSTELEVRKADGGRFWARVTTVPMKYQGGDALIHAIVDLSERVRAEAEIARQRESFHQKEKIAALGSLLAGLAHELNNPLSVVSGQSLMLEEAASDEGIIQRARRIREAAERCSRTVRTFLSMARSKAPERVAVALNDAVLASVDLVSHTLQSSGVEVVLDLDPELADVMADADQLHHLVSNLIVNAEHAMRETEPPRVLTIRTEYDATAKQIVLTVADNGPGVPEEILERIFEPFFTTKPGAAGTGIGLALCRDIAKGHGGDIVYRRNEPRGAVFTVRLPLAERGAKRPAAVHAAGPDAEKGRILVVDDDEEVALTLADVLRLQGHEVDMVFGASDGIDRARQKDYDIIISDVRMPGAGGPDLYKALQPEIESLDRRMMFMTGDTLRMDLEALVAGTPIPVIEKPLDPGAVAAMIATKLRENREAAA